MLFHVMRFQMSREKCQPTILIVNLSVCVFQMSMSVSVTESSGVLPSLTFSSVRVGGVVVVVGGCTDSDT